MVVEVSSSSFSSFTRFQCFSAAVPPIRAPSTASITTQVIIFFRLFFFICLNSYFLRRSAHTTIPMAIIATGIIPQATLTKVCI